VGSETFLLDGAPGVAGSVLQMVNHGISTGALFILVGVIYERRHTRDLDQFGGLARDMPLYTALFVIVALSSIGLPATNGFIGEFMVLVATFSSAALRPTAPWFAVIASTGVIFAAIYMLHAVLKMFWGPVRQSENAHLPDMKLGFWDAMALTPILVAVLWLTPFREDWIGFVSDGFGAGGRSALTAALVLVAVVGLHALALGFIRRARSTAPAEDGRRIESVAVLPLLALIFWIGVFPATFLDPLQPSADRFVADFQRKLQVENADDSVRLLDPPGGVAPRDGQPGVDPEPDGEEATGRLDDDGRRENDVRFAHAPGVAVDPPGADR